MIAHANCPTRSNPGTRDNTYPNNAIKNVKATPYNQAICLDGCFFAVFESMFVCPMNNTSCTKYKRISSIRKITIYNAYNKYSLIIHLLIFMILLIIVFYYFISYIL